MKLLWGKDLYTENISRYSFFSRNDPLPPLPLYVPTVFADLIAKCWRKKLEDRFADAQTFCE